MEKEKKKEFGIDEKKNSELLKPEPKLSMEKDDNVMENGVELKEQDDMLKAVEMVNKEKSVDTMSLESGKKKVTDSKIATKAIGKDMDVQLEMKQSEAGKKENEFVHILQADKSLNTPKESEIKIVKVEMKENEMFPGIVEEKMEIGEGKDSKMSELELSMRMKGDAAIEGVIGESKSDSSKDMLDRKNMKELVKDTLLVGTSITVLNEEKMKEDKIKMTNDMTSNTEMKMIGQEKNKGEMTERNEEKMKEDKMNMNDDMASNTEMKMIGQEKNKMLKGEMTELKEKEMKEDKMNMNDDMASNTEMKMIGKEKNKMLKGEMSVEAELEMSGEKKKLEMNENFKESGKRDMQLDKPGVEMERGVFFQDSVEDRLPIEPFIIKMSDEERKKWEKAEVIDESTASKEIFHKNLDEESSEFIEKRLKPDKEIIVPTKTGSEENEKDSLEPKQDMRPTIIVADVEKKNVENGMAMLASTNKQKDISSAEGVMFLDEKKKMTDKSEVHQMSKSKILKKKKKCKCEDSESDSEED
ncbi:titin homolog [Uloborus diversus]|uniref:titin homolog n=1 Tax=Uloborus diversus TaxID=327109 RepID=UPI00240A35BE|nr:titin homolog [Uloborus diversus]